MPHGVYIPVLLMRQTQFCKTVLGIKLVLSIKLVLNSQNTLFQSETFQILFLGFSSMPTTKKQKKATKSRGLELLSDIENLDITLGERHSERDESAKSNSARRPESVTSDIFGNGEENVYLNHTELSSGINADPGHKSASANSNAEIDRLSSELNTRLSQEVDEMMSSVNTQIQRAISDVISNQILPQIQNARSKREKFELFEDLFYTMIKMQPEMSEQMKLNHFHSLLRKNAFQTFRNISTVNRQTLEDVWSSSYANTSSLRHKRLPNISGTAWSSTPTQ